MNPDLQAGTWSVVQDGRGHPLAVIESVEVRVVPFLEVEDQFAFDEGEGDRTLAWWREAHRRYFARQPGSEAFSDQQRVQCERFRVVYRPAPS